ncbi:MAG: right-handed parallel beta-helix repeat-containing protein [Chlamydiales bacterium]|nr:right-handed parallel beta-helix repeat-containing protein [Chlamydiales bacterium]
MKLILAIASATALFASEPTASRGVLKHREHNGVGYDTGYTTAELFLCPAWKNDFMPFLDLRGHVFDNNQFASNIGIGLRYNWSGWAIGGNFYYDYREAQNINPHQLGGGLEFLSRYFDVRANGYAPIASTQAESSPDFEKFEGHSAIFTRRLRAALPAVDAEIGVPLGSRCAIVNWYAALGSYYLFEKTVNGVDLGNAVGGKGRIVFDLISRFNLAFDTTYDKIFKWTFQGTAGVSMPLGPRKKILRSKNFLCEARNQLPYRSEIIPVERKNQRQSVGNIIFVDNRSSSLGTFESPYPTTAIAMAASKPGDVIYIFPGDGTTTGYDTTITMLSDQTVQGSAADLDLGNGFVVPAQTPGNYPHLLGSGLGAIIPTINSTISGLDITSTTDGIRSDDPTIPVGGTNRIISNIIHDCGSIGMFLGHDANPAPVNWVITNNTISNSGSDGIRLLAIGTPDPSLLTYICADNTISNNGRYGFYFNPTLNAIFDLGLVRNRILDSTDEYNVYCYTENTTQGTFIASRNFISGSLIGLQLQSRDTSTLSFLISQNEIGNTVFNPGGNSPGVSLIPEVSSTMTGQVVYNELFNSINTLIEIGPSLSSTSNVTIHRNTLFGSPLQGTLILVPNSINPDLMCTLSIDDNLFYNNQSDNIEIAPASAGSYNITISNNYITDTNATGMQLRISGSATANINILNNTIFTSATNAIDMNPSGSSSMCATLFGNQAPLNEIEFQNTANLRLESPTPGSSAGLAETNTFKTFNPPTGSFYVAPGTCN